MDKLWIIDEVQHAGPEHLDEDYVAAYDRKAQLDPGEDIEILRAHGLSRSSTVVDFGAGTGTVALALAGYCRSVIAVEPSPAMRRQMAQAKAAAGIENMTIVEGGFLSYRHNGDPVDFVYTRNALHHLPDFWKCLALRNMHALLKPGGIARIRDLIYDFAPHEAEDRLAAWMAGAVEDAAQGWTAEELAEHVRQEYSTFRWLFEPMLAQAGFTIVDVDYKRHVYGAYTCRA